MGDYENWQYYEWKRDEDQVKLLSTLFYVYGGLQVLCGFFPIIHLIFGIAMLSGNFPPAGAPGPQGVSPEEQEQMVQFMGAMFTILALLFIVLAWAFAAAFLYVGYCLAKRKNHTFCFVMSILACMNVPLGTALGVFAIIVLNRPNVKTMFGKEVYQPTS